jgi:hypothetical protein
MEKASMKYSVFRNNKFVCSVNGLGAALAKLPHGWKVDTEKMQATSITGTAKNGWLGITERWTIMEGDYDFSSLEIKNERYNKKSAKDI